MIDSLTEEEILEQRICQLSDHEYVIEGFNYYLNNNPEKSEHFFKIKSDRTTILAGYAFVQCMVCLPLFISLCVVICVCV